MMSRYKIAQEDETSGGRKAYVFPPTRNIIIVHEYMKYCVAENAIFRPKRIREALVDGAAIRLSRENSCPILVWSNEKARIMSIANSYDNIYTVDDYPDKTVWVIAYRVPVPRGLKVLLVID